MKTRSNITVPILGLFLITGSIGYGINISEDFTNEEVVVNSDGNAINVIVDGLNITNTGTIKGNTLKNPGAGNGILNNSIDKSSIGDILNYGIISGFYENSSNAVHESYSVGCGINFLSNKLTDILKNSGIISGYSDKFASGNGIGVILMQIILEL